jgi:hypothetical protein
MTQNPQAMDIETMRSTATQQAAPTGETADKGEWITVHESTATQQAPKTEGSGYYKMLYSGCDTIVHMSLTTKHELNNMPPNADQMRFQVAWSDNFWWEMPYAVSMQLLYAYHQNYPTAMYYWERPAEQKGTYAPNGETTSINRYMIVFETMTQINLDTNKMRPIKIVQNIAA